MIISRMLEDILQTGETPSWNAEIELTGGLGHAVSRFIAALEAGVSGLDWAVLLRQCLRRLPDHARVAARGLDKETLEVLQSVGVSRALDGTLTADPYCPVWVADLGDAELDCPPIQNIERDQLVLGEPWLRRITGNVYWKSGAQRDATWWALNAPANSTVLVGLPTGSGKSLVYQCCAAFGSGLTVLIVPTVSLGMDQLAAVLELPLAGGVHPVLYTPENALDVLEALETRKCRLLITSPEAVVAGRLRGVLRRHAEEGFLCRLVVDEAHLVESWGADFRIEFQLLGAVLREWRAIAPSGIRTLLLSATFSPSTPPMLRELFVSEGVAWEQYIVQRLRPEIHYFTAVGWSTAEEQEHRVGEALRYLPRPAILYVTEVSEAREWGDRLRKAGFSRLRVFHGDTRSLDRKEIMAAWRNDEIDLVVATSAFGMGVDKPDVRAVVHACLPEGIDRFYQEVGRGGRDGGPCASLLVPTVQDERVARGLGPSLLSDPVKVNGRWREIWHSREPILDVEGHSTGAFKVRTDVKPEYLFSTESFGENIRWNKRLLLMMDRAGLIRIESLRSERSTEIGDFAEIAVIRPLRSTIPFETGLSELLNEPRKIEVALTKRATDRLVHYFDRSQPVCRELRAHYGSDTFRAYGSCGFCRAQGERPVIGGGLSLHREGMVTVPNVQVVQGPSLTGPRARAEVALALRQLLRTQRPIRIVVCPEHRQEVTALLELADDDLNQYRIDDLNRDCVTSIALSEAVIVIHIGAVNEGAHVFNRCGRWVAHWLLGGTIEPIPGRWAFMYDDDSRAYLGSDALGRWLGDVGRFQVPA